MNSRIARDTLLNLIGQVLPLGVALFAVPSIVERLGTERFGVLALAWTVLGSFSVFDVALGRAVTRFASEALGRGDPERLPGILKNAVVLQASLGLAGSLLFAAATPLLVKHVLDLSGPLAGETRTTFLILALSFPLTLVTGCLRSLLEALRRFDLINLVRAPAGASTFAIPWLGAAAGLSLPAIVALLVAARIAILGVHLGLCRHLVPGLGSGWAPEKPEILRLARFGGWVTAANLIPPSLVLIERFLIGALVSLQAVAWFSIPYEIVNRLWVLPTSVVAALFPVLSATGEEESARRMVLRALRSVLLLLALPVLAAVIGAHPLLALWLGPELAAAGAPVLRLLAPALLFSSVSNVAAAVLQAAGRPQVTARVRLLELPLTALLSWTLIATLGVEGAALAALLRAAFDASLLSWLAGLWKRTQHLGPPLN
ncbi:MAG TPA: flippase [Thermoanaerobaculia bacterium]|nr:flippase [Thermoanaerobaculia bacterium]